MVLGIKLEIDKGSVKSASKEIRDAAEKSIAKKEQAKLVSAEEKRIRKEKGIEDPADKKDAKGGVLGAAAIGGFFGSLIGSLKPVKELLGVIAGILQVFMIPILILMKPFLILFLKVGLMLLKAFGPGEKTKTEKAGTVAGILLGVFAAIAAFLLGASIGWIIALGLIFLVLGKKLFEFAVWLGVKLREGFTWLWENALLPAWLWVVEKIKAVGEFFIKAWGWIKDTAKKIWDWIVIGFKAVLDFGKMIWDFFLKGLDFISDLGIKIWNFFLDGLKGIANLGTMIWNWIKDSLGSFFGGGSSSVDDALITSSGQIVNLNQNDNVLAFQDFSQLNNVANATGNSRGSNIYINVEGFVGDEETLADKISRALSKSSRGSTSNFS